MRSPQIIFVTVVLALTVLPSISAMARNPTYVEPRYAGCYCYFGYLGGENKPECAPATPCASRNSTIWPSERAAPQAVTGALSSAARTSTSTQR